MERLAYRSGSFCSNWSVGVSSSSRTVSLGYSVGTVEVYLPDREVNMISDTKLFGQMIAQARKRLSLTQPTWR